MHTQPFVAFDGAVWEAGAGPLVPVHARNASSMTQWIAPVGLSSVVLRLLELQRQSSPLPPGRSETRRLSLTPDTIQAHALDLRRLLSPAGTGIVWAAVKPAEVLPRSVPPDGDIRHQLLQITNLGVSVKDSPQSTLVFVTRLDTGVPVPDARVAIVDAATRTRWRGTTDRDGVALAPGAGAAPVLRPPRSVVHRHGRKGRRRGLRRIELERWPEPVGPEHQLRPRRVRRRAARKRVHRPWSVQGGGRGTHQSGGAQRYAGRDAPGPGRQRPGRRRTRRSLSRGRSADGHREPLEQRRVDVARARPAPRSASYQIAISRAGGPCLQPRRTGTSRARFLVAAFRRPDFRVDATLTGDPAVLGSTLRGTVEAKYLFGGALGMRPVRWWFWRKPVQEAAAAIRERYPEARYAVGYLPGYDHARARMRGSRRRPRCSAPTAARTVALPTSPDGDAAYSVHVRGRRGGRGRPAHRQSGRARRASGVALRRVVAAAGVRGYEDPADGRRCRSRSCRQSSRGRSRDGVARPRAVGAGATAG